MLQLLPRVRRRKVQYIAVLRCPHCRVRVSEQMPSEGSVMHTKCFCCGKYLHAHADACCVYCSMANVPCPKRQRKQGRTG